MRKTTARSALAGRHIDSPVGSLLLAAEGGKLTHLLFAGNAETWELEPPSGRDAAVIDEAERQLGEYFAGRRRRFEMPLAPHGTGFQLAVWRALMTIPWGETISYGELADRVGRPGSARAVGAANGANPISVIVPCHRVIGANGNLTGYGGGLEAKRLLLELENGRKE